MADEQTLQNANRYLQMMVTGMATGTWDNLGDSSMALGGPIGNAVLKTLGEQTGVKEIAGEKPEDILANLGRIFIEKYGVADAIDVEVSGNQLRLKVKGYVHSSLITSLEANGVEKAFYSPIMNAGAAALGQRGIRVRQNIEKWPEGNGFIITYVTL